MKYLMFAIVIAIFGLTIINSFSNYKVIDTGQNKCYNDSMEITPPQSGQPFFGQDAQYQGTQYSYQDNGNGTITDLNTGLMWQKTPTITKYNWADALSYCDTLVLAGYSDWRAPSIKELWSIQDFQTGWPYINMSYFDLIGPPADKDQQFWSSNLYMVSSSPLAGTVAFGVNHGTGHIKAYPIAGGGPIGNKWIRAVRGNTYGINHFVNNNNGTITDTTTGLMWRQDDNGQGVDWKNALLYAETSSFAGYNDWRLPNIKELQSIVDYSGVYPALDTTYFNYTVDSAYFWSSTSAYFSLQNTNRYYAWYVAFGYAVDNAGQDMHGAGAVRFDTKVLGGPAGQDPDRIYNFVRCVRGGGVVPIGIKNNSQNIPNEYTLGQNYPNPFNPTTNIEFAIPKSGNVNLIIYNILGKEVATLYNGFLNAGSYTEQFDGSNLSSGVYFYRLTAGDFIETKKMLLIK